MERIREQALAGAVIGNPVGPGAMFCASPLATVPERFLEEILERSMAGDDLDHSNAMDLS